MFAPFIIALRAAGVPASITEYLALLRALKAGVAGFDVEDFYHLARAALVKDERHLDRFDRVLGKSSRDWNRRPAQRKPRWKFPPNGCAKWPRNS